MDIIEFLQERIKEDEERAKIAAQHFPTKGEWWTFTESLLDAANSRAAKIGLRHADKHSPEIILAECAAKRAILAYVGGYNKDVDPAGYRVLVQQVLVPMARPYADGASVLE